MVYELVSTDFNKATHVKAKAKAANLWPQVKAKDGLTSFTHSAHVTELTKCCVTQAVSWMSTWFRTTRHLNSISLPIRNSKQQLARSSVHCAVSTKAIQGFFKASVHKAKAKAFKAKATASKAKAKA